MSITTPKGASATSAAPSSSPLLSTTLSLVLLQLVSRLFSFSLNQLLLRSTTPQALGVATMGFEVVRDTGLFLVREGMRGAVVVSRPLNSYRRAFAYSHLYFSALAPLQPRQHLHNSLVPSSSRPTSPLFQSFSSASTPSSLPHLSQPTSTRLYLSTFSPPSSNSSQNDGTFTPCSIGKL